MTATATYETEVARLNLDYIAERGRWIDAHFAPAGEPVALDYCPGNGTSYKLIFVAPRGCDQLGDENVPSGLGNDYWTGWAGEGHRWAVVCKVNCSGSDWVYPFDLTAGNVHAVAYVGEKIGAERAYGDAVAITALFRAICGVPIA